MAIRSASALGASSSKNRAILPGYELQETVGVGAFARAYLCRVHGSDQLAVVKVTHADLIRGVRAEVFRRRFSSEVRALAAVRHPNLVRIHRAGLTPTGLPAIAMDFVAGPTLEQHLEDRGPMDPVGVLSLLGQLGSALHCVHERGIVHRDVSPQNVIWQDTAGELGRPVLLDFGVAAFVREDTSLTPVGTPRYMAPERGHAPATAKSDVFSLGTIGRSALAGDPIATSQTQNPVSSGLLSSSVVEPLLASMTHPNPRCRPSALQVSRTADVALRGPAIPGAPWKPRIAVVDDNPVTSTMLSAVCEECGVRVFRFGTVDALFRRACRREFDAVVLVGSAAENPVVRRALGQSVLAVKRQAFQRFDASVVRTFVDGITHRPAAWIRGVESWLDAWACVLDSGDEQCFHCAQDVDSVGSRESWLGSPEPPRLSRLLRALLQQGDRRAGQGLLQEIRRACVLGIRHRVKERVNDDP